MCASTHHTVATAIEADYMTYNLAQCKNSQAVSKHQPNLPVPLIPIKHAWLPSTQHEAAISHVVLHPTLPLFLPGQSI